MLHGEKSFPRTKLYLKIRYTDVNQLRNPPLSDQDNFYEFFFRPDIYQIKYFIPSIINVNVLNVLKWPRIKM